MTGTVGSDIIGKGNKTGPGDIKKDFKMGKGQTG